VNLVGLVMASALAGCSTCGPPAKKGASACKIFPSDNPWNTDVSALEVDAEAMRTLRMSPEAKIHLDWGIPVTVGNAAAPVPITWTSSYGERESDKGPYPIPLEAKIEDGSDRHIVFLAKDTCTLYELFDAERTANGFRAASGAIWKLDSNMLRAEGFTSADAAGLPILAGLVRREEIERGEITHALRFTLSRTRNAYIHPATHAAGKNDASLPPMGLRVRLNASFPESGMSGPALVIVRAMKKYGMLLADNGSDWFVTGETSDAWDVRDLNAQLGRLHGSDFDIVKTEPVITQPD
jgi:hypothetical protein